MMMTKLINLILALSFCAGYSWTQTMHLPMDYPFSPLWAWSVKDSTGYSQKMELTSYSPKKGKLSRAIQKEYRGLGSSGEINLVGYSLGNDFQGTTRVPGFLESFPDSVEYGIVLDEEKKLKEVRDPLFYSRIIYDDVGLPMLQKYFFKGKEGSPLGDSSSTRFRFNDERQLVQVECHNFPFSAYEVVVYELFYDGQGRRSYILSSAKVSGQYSPITGFVYLYTGLEQGHVVKILEIDLVNNMVRQIHLLKEFTVPGD